MLHSVSVIELLQVQVVRFKLKAFVASQACVPHFVSNWTFRSLSSCVESVGRFQLSRLMPTMGLGAVVLDGSGSVRRGRCSGLVGLVALHWPSLAHARLDFGDINSAMRSDGGTWCTGHIRFRPGAYGDDIGEVGGIVWPVFIVQKSDSETG